MSRKPLRVAGIDPGTLSVGLCVLEDGEVAHEQSIPTADLAHDPSPLVDALQAQGPLELVVGPSGYGLPMVRGEDLTERDLSLCVLLRADEKGKDAGVVGLRAIIRAVVAAGFPTVFPPGVIHLPTVPAYRKHNTIDMGTADKVCATVAAIDDQMKRRGCGPEEVSLILLELGGAFTAAVAVEGGRIVDGIGGSSGPRGAKAWGAMDGEVAYLLGSDLSKRTLFSAGALNGTPDGGSAYEEAAAKAALGLAAVVPSPFEVVLSGRHAEDAGRAARMGERLASLAPVRVVVRGAAEGAAFLADGLSVGSRSAIVRRLGLAEATGTVLDHVMLPGFDAVALA